jgi:hypothetical protein
MDDAPPLPGEVLKQRVEAACRLNGIGLRLLRGWLKEREIPSLLAEDMISGAKPQNFRNRRDLAETLHVPITWFVEPDWWVLIEGATEPGEEGGEDLRGRDLRHLGDDEDQAESA